MISADELLKTARQKTGLDDYGDFSFAEGLGILVKSINEESGLTPVNQARYRDELLRLLVNRLRMRRDIVNHPEILEEILEPPVFITSLPRTGSTKLHRMLGASGDFHAMKYWQAYEFAPFPNTPAGSPDPRIAATENHLVDLRQRAPGFLEHHPMYVDETEEEHLLLDAGFNGLYQHAAFVHIPTYVSWVMTLDRRAMFNDLRRMLQYLQWQHFKGKTRRWVLKTPGLLGTEATMEEVFPGIEFIATHRDPLKLAPSVAALASGTFQNYNDDVDRFSVGQGILQNFAFTVARHLEWRAGTKARVYDVRFEDVVSREFDVLQGIYGFLGMTLSETSRENVGRWIAMDAGRREPSRKFALSDFGLEESDITATFAAYSKRYHDFL